MKKNERGFSIVEIVLVVVVVGLVGIVGWLVYDRQANNTESSDDVNSQQAEESGHANNEDSTAEETTDSGEETSIESSNKYFTITLPDGWQEDEGDFGVTNEASFAYSNEDQAELNVIVNAAGFGPPRMDSDDVDVALSGNKFILADDIEFCVPDDSEYEQNFPCPYGDGKLSLMFGNAEKYRGNMYLFTISDGKRETEQAYLDVAEIVETIKLK